MTDEQNIQANGVPCEIWTNFGKGPFVVDKVDGWAYLAAGVFATGHWGAVFEGHPSNGAQEQSGEEDILIPYDKINYIKFDFAAYERYMDSPEPPVAKRRDLED